MSNDEKNEDLVDKSVYQNKSECKNFAIVDPQLFG